MAFGKIVAKRDMKIVADNKVYELINGKEIPDVSKEIEGAWLKAGLVENQGSSNSKEDKKEDKKKK